MTPNNNMSILPWYTSIDRQNARRWWVYGRVYPLYTPAGCLPPFQILRDHRAAGPIEFFHVYTRDGVLVGDYTTQMRAACFIKQFTDYGYDVIVYDGSALWQSFANGQYYATINDGTRTWYSEVFTVVNDLDPYLKIEWWDVEDFIMDAGAIVFRNGATQLKYTLYLQADIAKPEYPFEEEGEQRDGYFFPVKQISEKRFRFSFLASEYLLDVMRFIRMADFVQIFKGGRRYVPDTFLITPEWEPNGDVASVDAEFDTDTVAKKVGLAYTRATGGDFNDDFDESFDN